MDGEQALFEQFVNFKWLQNVLFHSVKDELSKTSGVGSGV